ncbi:hypothetical protein A4X09_0g2112 [Tilletia walkeri]|uniref:Uncharacterized protein n=1 Tax=Tilletia walkeri TaxID=117179 RepID=A0A8X7NC52_9BASI|nr:hypothetical protein A4X09_0g2112 [Tilletia walkeri]
MKTFTTATVLIASAAAASAISIQRIKTDACKVVSQSGYPNLWALGCSSLNVDPIIDLFRRPGESQEEFVTRSQMERSLQDTHEDDTSLALRSLDARGTRGRGRGKPIARGGSVRGTPRSVDGSRKAARGGSRGGGGSGGSGRGKGRGGKGGNSDSHSHSYASATPDRARGGSRGGGGSGSGRGRGSRGGR